MSKSGQMKRRVRAKQVQKVLERKQEKERAAVAKHVHLLQQQQAGDQNPHIQQLSQQLEHLVKGHNDLVTAYNVNWKNFADSIRQLDARLGALALVVDDLVRGGVDNVTRLAAADVPTPDHEAIGGVHWHAYIRLYVKKVEEDLARLKAQEAAAQEAPSVDFDPLITPPAVDEDTDADVFGGKDNGFNGEAQLQVGTSA